MRTEHEQRAEVLIEAAKLAASGQLMEGEALLIARWPRRVGERAKRTIKDRDRLNAFLSDGFRCRYTQERLFFTPLFEAMSVLWDQTFPTHPNWKTEDTHDAYWSHTASLDHVEPIAVGGKEVEENWVTTSAARNMVRSRFPLESLDWTLQPRAEKGDWDGGVRVFLLLMAKHREKLETTEKRKYLMKWERIAKRALRELKERRQ